MARLTTAEQLDAAIRTAAKEADPNTSSREAAESLYESDRALIDHHAREWIIEKLAWLIRLHRAKVRDAGDRQLVLDAEFGFNRLPRRLHFTAGTRIARRNATMRDLRKFRAELWKIKHPALEETDRAIALMRSHADRDPDITLGQVMELEAGSKRA